MESNFKFYQSFINLLYQNLKYRKEREEEYTQLEYLINNSNFRNFLINESNKDFNLVQLLSGSLTSTILKPQRLFKDTDDYYVACDMITNTYYICYKYLLMIDIDFYKGCDYKQVISFFDDTSGDKCWKLYKTRNGIHAFLINQKVDFHTKESVNIMLKYASDFYYIIYSYIRGYSVRLNKKSNEENIKYKFIKYSGNTELIDSNLENLTDIHIELLDNFKNYGISLMLAK